MTGLEPINFWLKIKRFNQLINTNLSPSFLVNQVRSILLVSLRTNVKTLFLTDLLIFKKYFDYNGLAININLSCFFTCLKFWRVDEPKRSFERHFYRLTKNKLVNYKRQGKRWTTLSSKSFFALLGLNQQNKIRNKIKTKAIFLQLLIIKNI